MHTQSAIIPLAVLFAALLSGCATILKNPRERVPIVGPDDVLVATVDSVSVPIFLDKSNRRYVELSAMKDAHLIVTGGGRRDTVLLEASPSPGYAAVDAVALFVGLAVDGVTGAWNSFNDQGITYLNDSIAKRVGRTEGWQAVSAAALSPNEGTKVFGISAGLFVNHLNLPTVMDLISPQTLVSGFGGQLALRVAPGFEIGASADVTHGVDFEKGSLLPFRPTADNGGLVCATLHGFVRTRVSNTMWVFVSGGMTKGEIDYGVYREVSPELFAGSGWTSTIAAGTGYHSGLYFIEVRAMASLRELDLRSVSDYPFYPKGASIASANFFLLTLRSGLHIGI